MDWRKWFSGWKSGRINFFLLAPKTLYDIRRKQKFMANRGYSFWITDDSGANEIAARKKL